MGRKKIEMKPITDKKAKKDTFHKRKLGLLKKAAELSLLCNVRMLLVFEDLSGEVIKYSTDGLFDPIQYFKDGFINTPIAFTKKHYPDFFKNITVKKGLRDDDIETEGNNDYDDSEDEDGNQIYMPSETDYPVSEALSENLAIHGKKSKNKDLVEYSADPGSILQMNAQIDKTKKQSPLLAQIGRPEDAFMQATQNLQNQNAQFWQQQQPIQNQGEKSRNNQQAHRNMDLEIIEEEVSSKRGSQVENVKSSKNFNNQGPKYLAFKKENNTRLKLSQEDEEQSQSKKMGYPTKRQSPGFTASPIGYSTISPIQMNSNMFLFEFNEPGRGLTPSMTPNTGKASKFHYLQQQAGATNPSYGLLSQNYNPNAGTPEEDMNKRNEKGYFNSISGDNSNQDLLNNSGYWFPRGGHLGQANMMFGFGGFGGVDLEAKDANLADYKFEVPRGKDVDLDTSGMRLFAPSPLLGIQRNTNQDWLLQHFYPRGLDRSMQEEGSFLNTSKADGVGASDLSSLSIAKSPMPVKKQKEGN